MRRNVLAVSYPWALTILAVLLILSDGGWAISVQYKVLHRFDGGANGGYPNGPLLEDKAGNFYGTTSAGGGPADCGTVFELQPPGKDGAWSLTTLYTFTCGSDGGIPINGLTADKDGNLYGTTWWGGNSDNGVIFQLTPPLRLGDTWTEAAIYDFTIPEPYPGGLAIDEQGNLYSTTEYGGGAFSGGTVFRLAPPTKAGGVWAYSLLYHFRGVPDGAFPQGGVIIGKDGDLYGTTTEGGRGRCSNGENNVGCGTIFQLRSRTGRRRWSETVLYSFRDHGDGYGPAFSLALDKKGALYGIDFFSAFKLRPPFNRGGDWVESTLYSFQGGVGGTGPYSSLIFDAAGNLYGTGDPGGIYGYGTIYELTPPRRRGRHWEKKALHTMRNPSANQPWGGVTLSKGSLYGVTRNIGSNQYGAVYEIELR